MCDQQGLRSACAHTQSDQSLCWSLECSMIVKLLTEHHLECLSLKGGCRGSSESTNINNVVCATSKASDQPAHTSSLIRAFAGLLSILLTEHHLECLSFKGGCRGLSESTQCHVKMPYCWKSHALAHNGLCLLFSRLFVTGRTTMNE